MKIPRAVLLFAGIACLAICFVYDIVRNAISTLPEGGDLLHILLAAAGFILFAFYIADRIRQSDINPVRHLGKLAVIGLILMAALGVVTMSSLGSFVVDEGVLMPKNYGAIIAATLLSVTMGGAAIIGFITLTDLIFVKRRKSTKRNYIILLVAGGLQILRTLFPADREGGGTATTLLTVLVVAAIVLNSMRLSWIVYLSRREKLYSLLFSFFGLTFYTILTVFSHEESNLLHQSLVYYQPSLYVFVSSLFLFAAVYGGMSFASTLFQLPTAEAFDRKKVEISSLHNMSRLINQVLDYDELLTTTVSLARDVTEGNAAWLQFLPAEEKLHREPRMTGAPNHRNGPAIVQSQGADKYLLSELFLAGGSPVETLVYESKKAVVIHDFGSDRRVNHLARHKKLIGSLALLPLHAHGEVIGVLGIVKHIPYSFDRDIMNVLTAFTDLVVVALENNRLIGQSIVRERLEQELMVAQQMQQKLLPQKLPESPEFDMSAISLPAYEVGGDYYDVMRLDENRLGLVIGDVSGKGVSAALYMAQVKGIFQSLCMQSRGAKDLLVKTNAALYGNIDRKAFVSLLYAILDLESGTLQYARAGHCPVLYLHGDAPSYLKPGGMGLGLDHSARFVESIQEESIALHTDDLIILYTDGITEARSEEQEEFGYDRLARIVSQKRGEPTHALMHTIIHAVKSFTGGGAAEDDITLLLLRWNGRPSGAPAAAVRPMEMTAT